MTDTTASSNLNRQLWAVANTLRGKMNADDYRDYILGLIFYKYLSERMRQYANDILKNDKVADYSQLREDKAEDKIYLDAVQKASVKSLGFYLKPSFLFGHFVERIEQNELSRTSELITTEDDTQEGGKEIWLIEDLEDALKFVESSTVGSESEKDFEKLFEDLDLNSTKIGRTVKARNQVLVSILEDLEKIDFRIEDSEVDILGDAYEYLIGEFASNAGKKAGEFYTPQQVSSILAQLVTSGDNNILKVYDPTCGSGSLLLRVAKASKNKDLIQFYGQEMNRTTYNLARMNLIMHDVKYRNFDIKQEDTLIYPQHRDLVADAIVANPPFSSKWTPSNSTANDERFANFGRLAPRTKADFAFVQHMIHHLSPTGTMAVVLPHGVLFRSAAEEQIRRYLIETVNYLDAVIGLPANIFYGTSIPTCILVFKKQRQEADNVLFVDASQGFQKVKTQNELRPADIEKIVETYKARATKDKYSYLAPLSEIVENDYNLNIPRYVDTFEEETPVDLSEVSQGIKNITSELNNNSQLIADFCQELGIDSPF